MPRHGPRAGVHPLPTLGVAVVWGTLALGCTPARREMAAAVLDAEARETLANVSFDDPTSLLAVAALQRTPASVQAAKEVLASGATGAPRWAAVWVLASGGDDPAPVRGYLDDPEPSIRLVVAADLVARGDAAGFDPLVKLLAIDAVAAGSVPERTVQAIAAETLGRFTGQESDTPWASWVETNRTRLAFDAELGTWSVK